MGRQLTLLSDAEWARIEPLLSRGRRGARRVDDRRMIAVAIDTTHIRAHRSAAGAKGGLRTTHRLVAGRPHQQAPRTDRRSRPPSCLADLGRQQQRHDDGRCLIDATAGRFDRLIADRGYDTNAIRAAVTALGAEVVIPSTLSRAQRAQLFGHALNQRFRRAFRRDVDAMPALNLADPV